MGDVLHAERGVETRLVRAATQASAVGVMGGLRQASLSLSRVDTHGVTLLVAMTAVVTGVGGGGYTCP